MFFKILLYFYLFLYCFLHFQITVIVILDLLYFASFTVNCIFFFSWLQRTLQTQGVPQRHGFLEFLTTTVGVQNIRFILTRYITAVLLSLGFVYIGQKPEQYLVRAVSCPSTTPRASAQLQGHAGSHDNNHKCFKNDTFSGHE